MNKSKLKTYAPQARKDFIAAVTARANQLGLSASEILPAERKGDITLIAGRSWPSRIHAQREKLVARIRQQGFDQVMEAAAYSWFNRFAALRYMELHDYLEHGYRVLSNPVAGLPEILQHAQEVDLPSLKKAEILQLQLDGNKDGEIYRQLLLAQCNALYRAIPFLFEKLDDETELLLPDNLLLSDSVVAKLVTEIAEEDWQQVEIIGWLYQFYISEKKDQVIGKVVKSEDIPAATQLFTPNWIVQYLVQNSVGRLWLMANPQSTLAKEWPYYITPAEQTPEVQAQLDALIQTRVREDGDTLNPESITVLDPACGSGHILVVAYDVLKAIYLERGYQPRAIPRLILEKNLYGLDIDDRAAQMAGFALLMKARADDRRLFTATDDAGNLQPPRLNVVSLQESKSLSVDELAIHLAPFKVPRSTITALVEIFEHAKTFGSLIQIPYALKTNLAMLPEVLALVKQTGDMYASAAADDLLPLVQQAQILAMQFDAVVANPPYMGSKGMNVDLKDYAKLHFSESKADTFSMFMERCKIFGNATSELGFVTPYVWMFISTYESLRTKLVSDATLKTLIQLEYNAFEPACVPVCTFTLSKSHTQNYVGGYVRLSEFKGHETQAPRALEAIANHECGWFFECRPDDFRKVPGSPIAYWMGEKMIRPFQQEKLSSIVETEYGIITGDNGRFLRLWYEIDQNQKEKWIPFNKGGSFRKWYGNLIYVVDWESSGDFVNFSKKKSIDDAQFYDSNCLTWSDVTSGSVSFRLIPRAHLSSNTGPTARPKDSKFLYPLLAYLNTKYIRDVAEILNPTLHFTLGDFGNLPLSKSHLTEAVGDIAKEAIKIAKLDWDAFEESWDFQFSPVVNAVNNRSSLADSWLEWDSQLQNQLNRLRGLEIENNQLFIDSYGLQNELSSEVPESQITLARADREKDSQRLISYAIGCMMGRYSLDEPGLIYAHAGNVGFEPGRYATFLADADGIVPITDELWFADDACSRIREFLCAVWGPDTLEDNMAWLAESLGTKATETPDETIRRYVADKFFKDHLQTYKKRPIYWLFSSGKQGAFQALVYLHRYNEGTLARMRSEYVVPLTGKMQSRIALLEQDRDSTTATAARNKISKQIESLRKKHIELLSFDEKLRHYADMRIKLDLDDGVKVSYGKFGDLLDSVKAITGASGDD